jgi:hypothetical protein
VARTMMSAFRTISSGEMGRVVLQGKEYIAQVKVMKDAVVIAIFIGSPTGGGGSCSARVYEKRRRPKCLINALVGN